MDPETFRMHLKAEMGEKAADLITVNPGEDKGGRPKSGEETGAPGAPVSNSPSERKEKVLRAVLRAPEVVQELYKDDRLTQKDAARLGPKSPTPEQAARIAEVRQELEQLDTTLPKPAFRKQAKEVIDQRLGSREPKPIELLWKVWARVGLAERREFLAQAARQAEVA